LPNIRLINNKFIMASIKTVFKVIKSMTMNEKRYFKIYCNKSNVGSQNKYVEIFNYISKIQDFDEEVITNELKSKNYSTINISADINYLSKIVFKSLNEFHAEKLNDIKLKNTLNTIEILFYKGLYEECLRIIHKLKIGKSIKENPYLLMNLLNWEKKCVGYSKGLLEAIEINNGLTENINNITLIQEITDCYYKSYYYKNNIGKIPIEKLKEGFEVLMQHPNFTKKIIFTNLISEIFYDLTFANYHHVYRNYDQEIIYLQKVITIYENNFEYRYENPLDYVAIYMRIINLSKNETKDKFYEKLNHIRSFDNYIDIQKDVVKERMFIFTHQAEIEFLLTHKLYIEAENLMYNIENNALNFIYSIEPYYRMSLFYLFASILCINNDFRKGLKYINKILNEFKFEDRPNLFIKAEFLNIIIHFELKNHDLVLHNITTLNRKYTKIFKLNEIESKILKTIFKISSNPNIKNERIMFGKLYENYKGLYRDNLININYLEYIKLKSGK
jgi:hypothetical protein